MSLQKNRRLELSSANSLRVSPCTDDTAELDSQITIQKADRCCCLKLLKKKAIWKPNFCIFLCAFRKKCSRLTSLTRQFSVSLIALYMRHLSPNEYRLINFSLGFLLWLQREMGQSFQKSKTRGDLCVQVPVKGEWVGTKMKDWKVFWNLSFFFVIAFLVHPARRHSTLHGVGEDSWVNWT